MLFKNIKLIDGNYEVQSDMYVRTKGAFIDYIGKECPE